MPRARARIWYWLSVSPSFFFSVFPFLRLFYATARFFSPFLVDAGLLGNYQSGSSDRKYPAHPSPFATCVRGRPRRHSASHFCFPSSLLRPGVSAAAAIAIRSLTNLFDKSPRLIGLTTRPRLFFPSAKFTVVTRLLVAPSSLQVFGFYLSNFSAAT